MNGAIVAASPDANRIRFIDQDLNTVWEASAGWASYKPSGLERFVRVEAVAADGKTAWSQPFWILANAPQAQVVPTDSGVAVAGRALPGSRVDVSDEGHYVASVVANDQGAFQLALPVTIDGRHDVALTATGPWPDQVLGSPGLVSYSPG